MTILNNVCVSIVFISGEKESGGRVLIFSIDTRQAIALAIFFLLAPSASKDLIWRFTDTVGSPFSILATLDWLDFNILANCVCIKLLF